MAFSVLRVCARSTAGVFEKNSPVAHIFKNVNQVKNLRQICECAAIVPAAEKSTLVRLATRDYSKHVKHRTEKKYSSDSDSDSDMEVMGHRAESKFWRRKIRTFHGLLDINKDGVISFDDFKIFADRFVRLGHLSKKSAKELNELMKHLWEIQWGEINQYNLITVEQYLEDMHHVLNDKDLVKKAHSFLPYLFEAVDKDKSGEITVEEFKLFFKCLGLRDEDAVCSFRIIDTNTDGKINAKEFVKHGRDFFLTEDESRVSKYFWGPLVEV